MGLQAKKRLSPKKGETSSVRQWPDLPKQLLSLIARQSTLMQNLSFGGFTKAWRAAPRQCNPSENSPWLHPYPDINNGNGTITSHTFNIIFRTGVYSWYGWWPYQHPWKRFLGYSHGVLMGEEAVPSHLCLCDPVTNGQWRSPPPWNTHVPSRFSVLSLSPSESFDNCFMTVLTGISRPAFMFYRFGGPYEWIKQDCNLVDPYAPNQQCMQFTNAIGFNGKVYALSLQGTLVVVEHIDSQFKITASSSSRAVPSVPSKHFKEYLVQFDGEIFLIFLIFEKLSNAADNVEVVRLQFPRLSWVQVKSLGEKTLFAGAKTCMWVTASKVGCRSNCIYFSEGCGWLLYDMESGNISPEQSCLQGNFWMNNS
ncbi:hypothetical protein RJ639_006081 [Escallonia herrerae]|uniref:KIB1-4 beta-propeller domain-containing protein n=1 Tax=Escallonia herrerae TaxID=1293975 RepID=A0AA88W351_9ASTE|nr:hypothetical protein RJ639_006081 [Escallonia herrerae]